MRWVLLLILLSVCDQSKGQKIYFSDTSNVWNYTNPGSSYQPYIGRVSQRAYTGVTNINGMDYSILSYSIPGDQSFYLAYIREDTFLHQVFIRLDTSAGGFADTFEHVLYDYNLQLGDTFRFSPDYGVSQFIHVVTSIDSVMIGGIIHKVWTLDPTTPPGGQGLPYVVIEGIGSATETLFPAFPFYFEYTSYLYCFQNKGINPAIVPPKTHYTYYYESQQMLKQGGGGFDNTTSCNYLTSVKETIYKNGLKVYPQPAVESFTINFPRTIATGEIIMMDVFGRTIWQEPVNNRDAITLQRNNLPSGLYMLKVTDLRNKTIYTEKITID